MFDWYKIFLEGREVVEVDESPGHPAIVKTNENMKKVRPLV
jgi:hypothetical protein